ncbi:MAG: glutamine-hydrolyzing GMP synthase [Ruthenibacterium sp.]|nr:glutamine-hydrolyzing GMP synthase [Candidatus Ruthenibacterium merdipullorum]
MTQDMAVILDLGSEESARVAREVRSLGVYSEIHPHDITLQQLSALGNVRALILNGGPNRMLGGTAVAPLPEVLACGLPMLAIDFDGAPAARHIGALPADEQASTALLHGFLFDECHVRGEWDMENFIESQVQHIRSQVGGKKVLLALSGGVDSSVVAALLLKAIGPQLTCVHVNHGLLRKGEPEQVVRVFRDHLGANLVYVDAQERFLSKLAGVADPEQKRKIIGAEFIRVFEEEARKLDGIEFLAQGTIYPDIIESGTKTNKVVKSHHNVGGLPDDLKFELVEPVRQLFKDEVRACGAALGLPYDMVYRQPFPGPGLGVRCLGAITKPRLEALRESDAILREEFAAAGLDKKVWQYFTIVPDLKSVGVRNNARCEEWPAIIRAVNTVDAMTAEIEEIPYEVLHRVTKRIITEVPGINRVCYDLTPKPTGTIEWE